MLAPFHAPIQADLRLEAGLAAAALCEARAEDAANAEVSFKLRALRPFTIW